MNIRDSKALLLWNKENQPPENSALPEENTHKKKKARKAKDVTYSAKNYSLIGPGGEKRKSASTEPGEYPAMLYDLDKTFKTETGKEVAIKTSVAIDFEALKAYNDKENIDWSELGNNLAAAFSSIASFRPIQPSEFSDTFSPIKGTTPDGKTILTRVKKIGFLSFYTNKPLVPLSDIHSERTIAPDSEFFQSECYASIKEIHQTIKTQQALISRLLLKKTQQDNAQRNGRSQNREMVNEGVLEKKGSANEYVKATALYFEVPLKWQWLHMIPYSVRGKDSQSAENLVAGGRAANYDMTTVENQIKNLAKKYPDGFQLIVEAELIAHTHIGITMKYYIKTKDFCLPFEFNLQNPNLPHISQTEYMKIFINQICEAASKPAPKVKRKLELENLKFPLFVKTPQQKVEPTTTTTTTTNEPTHKLS